MSGTLRNAVIAVALGVGMTACGPGGASMPTQGPMPVGATWDGKWRTSWGPLVMEQKGDEVIGVYKYGNGTLGAIAGKMEGNYLRFAWAEKGGAGKGHGVFGMSANGNTFGGSWGYHESVTNGGSWSGNRE